MNLWGSGWGEIVTEKELRLCGYRVWRSIFVRETGLEFLSINRYNESFVLHACAQNDW